MQNPLDVTGAAIIDPTIFTRAIGAISRDPSVGVVGVIQGVPWFDDGTPYVSQRFVDAIGDGIRDAACPVAFINQVVQPITDYTRSVMAHGNVSYYPRPAPGDRRAPQRRLVVQGHPARASRHRRRTSRAGPGAARARAARPAVGGRGPPAARRGRVPRRRRPPRHLRRRRSQGGGRIRQPGLPQGRLAADSPQDRHRRRAPSTSPPTEAPVKNVFRNGDQRREKRRRRHRRRYWSARCAGAVPNCWSAWSATRTGARWSRWRSAASSSRYSKDSALAPLPVSPESPPDA